MSYIDTFVIPVPQGRKQAYREAAEQMAPLYQGFGAIRIVEAWGDELHRGQRTDFYRAVHAEEGETVVLSVVTWPSKQVRDAAWQAIMADPSMKPKEPMPFDGKRMFWGGFAALLDEGQAAAGDEREGSEG